jgi:hypothetical protein
MVSYICIFELSVCPWVGISDYRLRRICWTTRKAIRLVSNPSFREVLIRLCCTTFWGAISADSDGVEENGRKDRIRTHCLFSDFPNVLIFLRINS